MVWEVERERGKVHEIVRFFSLELLSFLASLSLLENLNTKGALLYPFFKTSDEGFSWIAVALRRVTGSTLLRWHLQEDQLYQNLWPGV